MAAPAFPFAAIAVLPLLTVPAEARPVTASQLSAAPYGRVPIRSNRPEWEIYNANRPGGSPFSGVVGYPGPDGKAAWGDPGASARPRDRP